MSHTARSIARLALVSLLAALCLMLEVAGGAEANRLPPAALESDSSRVIFELDVQPIFTAAGCNTGACHGKARGQNGFALSLLGFDPNFDYDSIVLQSRGRRVFPAAPDYSLLLQKPSAQLPHGGGKRLDPAGPEYQTVRRWIATGMPRATKDDPTVVGIALAPAQHVLPANSREQLVVTAEYSDGTTRDVTRLTSFASNEAAVVSVDRQGQLTAGALPGEASIMARYMGNIATWNTAVPLADSVDPQVYAGLPRYNVIDGHVWNRLQTLGITPSEPAADSKLLRRLYLDIIGRLPTPQETRDFLADASPDKRGELIDALLARPEYADHWANKWADLLRPNPYRVGIKATRSLDAWLRDAFRRNLPYDQFVRGLVTAQGSTWRNGATTIFRDRRSPDEITTLVSQLFLGTRLECAKCHQHPFEIWGQKDFYSLAAFFARVGYKGTGLSPPISGGEEIIFTADSGDVRHPLTGETLPPRPLFGAAREIGPEDDPRVVLVDWMLADGRQPFARVAVNRVWAELMGRGLVDPVDDLRATNPPSNPELLDALAEEFRAGEYDLKRLIRLIASSYVYGLSSLPGERNVADTRNYSRHYRQRLRAETLFDAICDVTEVPESFEAMPSGSRAVELWTHRVDSLFLDAFGRPDANQDPPCERTPDTTMVQALHLMNAPGLHNKVVSDAGRAARLAKSDQPPAAIVEELYLACYSRPPTSEESAATTALFSTGERRPIVEDLLWALINSPEFVFKD
ncbi:MAG: DUF1549 and DUF1553 domain-containing protein [Pirellulales bacterium]|nr:DUF1549 and DUF1553 domain-containing protein [Pirellulales bacterium]